MPQNQKEKILQITSIQKTDIDDSIRIAFHLGCGEKKTVLYYQVASAFRSWLCYDRCDAAVTALFLAAMKAGYDAICSEYPISEQLYYHLTYHVIPQLCVAGAGKLKRIRIEAPITKMVYHGKEVATGMSRGVDSFATMFEYGKDFPMEDYRITAFTYFQAGAHHGYDKTVGRGGESKQELFRNQMEKSKEFCKSCGYPMIVVESNVAPILYDPAWFCESSFDRTHTFRNFSMAMLLQKKISKYYYSSTYTLNEFKLTLNADMAYYERWLIPHLSTGSISFYQSNQDWSRMAKVESFVHREETYDNLQVCLTKSGNCGKCLKCRRTLMELDALGDDVLERYRSSFDLETYRREDRKKWFGSILEDKEKPNSEAHYYDEIFVCAAKHHPDLLGDYVSQSDARIRSVCLNYDGINIRALPSIRSEILFVGKKNQTYPYLGEAAGWVCISTENGRAFVTKRFVTMFSK